MQFFLVINFLIAAQFANALKKKRSVDALQWQPSENVSIKENVHKILKAQKSICDIWFLKKKIPL